MKDVENETFTLIDFTFSKFFNEVSRYDPQNLIEFLLLVNFNLNWRTKTCLTYEKGFHC